MADSAEVEAFATYLAEVGAVLTAAGCPVHRLERLLSELSKLKGCRCQSFIIPTGIFVAVEGPDGKKASVQMNRIEEWSVNLGRLAAVDEIITRATQQKLSMEEALVELRTVDSRGLEYPAWASAIASVIVTSAAAVFLGGDWPEVGAAALGGLLMGALGFYFLARPQLRFLQNFVGGAVAGSVAMLGTFLSPDLSRQTVVLAVILVLLPGMTLTTGLNELTSRNLVAGTSRLMDAMVTLLSLVLGIGLVLSLEEWLGPALMPASENQGLPWWLHTLALVLMAAAVGVRLGVPRSLLGWSMGSVAVAWFLGEGLRAYLPGYLGVFISALMLALFSNVVARATDRPVQLILLPGLLLLVPGSFGFKSIEALLRGELVEGAAQAASMFMISGALVMGMVMADVVWPTRKAL